MRPCNRGCGAARRKPSAATSRAGTASPHRFKAELETLKPTGYTVEIVLRDDDTIDTCAVRRERHDPSRPTNPAAVALWALLDLAWVRYNAWRTR